MITLDQIETHFQPIFNKDLKLHGFELLSRLRGADNQSGNSAEFLKALEHSQIMVDITLNQVRIVRSLMDSGIGCKFSINVNEYTLGSQLFIKTLLEIPRHYLTRLSFEISEQIKLYQSHCLMTHLRLLSDNGFNLGLDDVFSEQSSILPVMSSKISYLKADMSIIRTYSESVVRKNLLKTMVYYCGLSSIPCVAEGIDSYERYQDLRDMGIGFFQGNFLSKPLNLDGMLDIYRKSLEDDKNDSVQ